MKALLDYLNGLTLEQQTAFAKRCETSVGYLRKAASRGQQLGGDLCINIERESARAVVCEQLRPDVDWAYLRRTGATPATPADADPLPTLALADVPAWDGVDRRTFLDPASLPADLERRQNDVTETSSLGG